MRESTTPSLFPDINVWVALSYGAHVHHLVASDWFNSLGPGTRFTFCRFTQLGLLRLLTAEAVMGDEVLTQAAAWKLYDAWLRDDRVAFAPEPPGLDPAFRARTRLRQAAPKTWADAYLAAFAEASSATLVTFDKAFHRTVRALGTARGRVTSRRGINTSAIPPSWGTCSRKLSDSDSRSCPSERSTCALGGSRRPGRRWTHLQLLGLRLPPRRSWPSWRRSSAWRPAAPRSSDRA